MATQDDKVAADKAAKAAKAATDTKASEWKPRKVEALCTIGSRENRIDAGKVFRVDSKEVYDDLKKREAIMDVSDRKPEFSLGEDDGLGDK